MMSLLQKKRQIIGLISFFILFTLSTFAESVKSYNITAEIKPSEYKIIGNEIITFIPEHNTDNLLIHLYWNGLQKNTSLYKGAPKSLKKILDKKPRSQTTIEKIKINNRNIDNFKFKNDKTLLKVDYSFKKNRSYTIKIVFTSKIPKKRYLRFGYSEKDKTYWISQWFPKIAVLSKDNKWNAEPFYYNYEFFSEYSNYNLKVKFPKEYKIVSNLKKKNLKRSSTHKVYQGSEKNISDCVLGISKNFKTVSKQFDNLKIQLTSYKKLSQKQQNKILERTHFDIKTLSTLIGPYQYNEFKIVNLATIGRQGSGMEYPKLIQMGETRGGYMRVLDHEIAHQWFYGMIGFDQTNEGWLDEGYTSYYEIRLSEHSKQKEKPRSIFMGLTNFDFHYIPVSLAWLRNKDNSLKKGNIFRKNFLDSEDGYKTMFHYYMKHPVVLKFLESEIGKNKIDTIFKKIYSEYLFKHPDTNQILKIFKDNLSKADYNLFINNLKSYSKTDVSIKEEGNYYKISKEKNYKKPVKIIAGNSNSTKSFIIEEKSGKIKKDTYNYIKTPILDYNLGNNFVINSFSFSLKNYLYAFVLFLIFALLIYKLKNKRLNFLSKNIFFNNLIFAPLFIYTVSVAFPLNIYNNLNFDFSSISAIISRMANNPPSIIIGLTIFLLIIKFSAVSTFFYKRENATYSIFTILVLDLISVMLIVLYIISLFLTKEFSIFYFMIFILGVSFIEPIKIYFLRKEPEILYNLKSGFLSHFAITLVYAVLFTMLLFIIAPFFLKLPFSILIFITLFSLLEHIYRWANFKLINYYTGKDNNESKKRN